MRRVRVAFLAVPAALALAVVAGSPAAPTAVSAASTVTGCPPGFLREPVHAGAHSGYAEIGRALDAAQRAAGTARPCVLAQRPEPLSEIGDMAAQRLAKLAAPTGRIPADAYRLAIAQKAALAASGTSVPGANGTWTPLGTTPLIGDEPGYDAVNGEGMTDLAGRIDSLDYDAVHGRVFATIGTGGVWMSEDAGDHWRSISDTMPTQTVGAVGWTSAGGTDGTVVVVGGEPLMGGDTYTGLGAFYTRDLGRTWQHSTGVPAGVMGFQVAVDRAHPSTVYAATSMGLWRSTDGGASFVNTRLPTSTECAGSTSYTSPCEFANFVTDVSVLEPGGKNTTTPAGTVVAAVGYRAGQATFPDGKVQSPGNGIYRSATGAPGSFQKLDVSSGVAPASFAPQDHIGRVELGAATGPAQDHDYLYAIVEDAVLFNGGAPVIDVPDDPTQQVGLPYNTVFNGVYVSSDFGASWTRMADDNEVSESPLTQSALVGTGQATLYAPGVQAWYDEWIHPDPTRADANGVPTRLAFGLEEVWQNRLDGPQDATEATNPSSFVVVGPYYSGDTCVMLSTGLPSCPTTGTGSGDTTTHPDQQDGLWVPDASGGGVSLLVGNDGGAFRQHAASGQALTNTGWGRGKQNGFHTLLAYDGEPAKDGTVWFGLQDNGSGKITPEGRQIEAFGGDGFYVAVNPSNSAEAYEEYTYGDIRVTIDGGKSWRSLYPPISNGQFANPFVMDPTDPNHLITAGPEVVETTYGPNTSQMDPTESACLSNCWAQVFDIGSANQMSAIDLQGDASYVGWCGACDVLNKWSTGFHRGIATNVGGSAAPKRMTSAGWHQAAAKGLPNRYITSIAIDPKDARTVYVTLGGYNNREWVPPGSYLDQNAALGKGHVFVSHDAAATFTDISGSLPDTSASWVELHGSQLVVGTDIGAFLSSDLEGASWTPLTGLPTVPISTIRTSPADPNTVVVATFGRGIWSYQFPATSTPPTTMPPAPAPKPVTNPRPVSGGTLAATGLPVGIPVLGLTLIVAAALTRRRGRAG